MEIEQVKSLCLFNVSKGEELPEPSIWVKTQPLPKKFFLEKELNLSC